MGFFSRSHTRCPAWSRWCSGSAGPRGSGTEARQWAGSPAGGPWRVSSGCTCRRGGAGGCTAARGRASVKSYSNEYLTCCRSLIVSHLNFGFYLPGVAAPPAGLRGDVQTLAAGL